MDDTGFEQVKRDVHRTLLTQLDLEKLSAATNGSAKQAVASLILEILAKEKLLLNASEKDKLQSELLDEVFGFGPLEALLGDPTISDILVNRKDLVYVERAGISAEGRCQVSGRPAPAADYRPNRGSCGPAH